jgi:hypothetical protein
VESRIEALRKAGKAGAGLAQKVSRLIEGLASGAFRHHMDEVGSYTKYGEKRIKGCRKFDLGCGFRLITLQRGTKVLVPFLGTHDECQRWLQNNSRMKEMVEGSGRVFWVSDASAPHAERADQEFGTPAEDIGASVLSKVTDRELRQVFYGLVEGARKRQVK